MSPEQAMVKEFHQKYGAPAAAVPRMPTVKDRMRRARLILTEAAEFIEAADKDDFVGTVDALADILVVTYGTAVEMGVDLEPVFAEIHRSNMSKDGGMDVGGKILKGSGFRPPAASGGSDTGSCRQRASASVS